MTIRILAALALVSLLSGSATALPLKPLDTTADIVLVGGGHGHGHAHGNRGRHLGWAHSRHRMH